MHEVAIPDRFDGDMAHVVSVSGGKDSTCTYLLAIELLGPTGFVAVFADTGWEHPATYEYVRRLPEIAGGPPIQWVRRKPASRERIEKRAANIHKHFVKRGKGDAVEAIAAAEAAVLATSTHPFKELTMLFGGFPFRHRFCTEHLKVVPMREQVIDPILAAGKHVVSWQGVRADESPSRKLLPETQELATDYAAGLYAWRPILAWTLADVKAFAAAKGVPLNPLYAKGFSRVGCFPCVYARKKEIRLVAELSPERIDEIAEWEIHQNRLTTTKMATFFPPSRSPLNKAPFHYEEHGVRSIVEWSKTEHGGRRRAPVIPGMEEFVQTDCDKWGACET